MDFVGALCAGEYDLKECRSRGATARSCIERTEAVNALCKIFVSTVALLIVLAGSGSADAGSPLAITRVASGLERPVFATHRVGVPDRLFIVEQRGVIQLLDLSTGLLAGTPFLDIDSEVLGPVAGIDERGMLGLAFHPDAPSSPFLYVSIINSDGDIALLRYEVSADPDVADPGSAHPVLTVPQIFANHNGGWIGFGSDGYLYMAIGDGGGPGCDGDHDSQDIDVLLGKVIRIDVDADDFPADPQRNYRIPPDNPLVGVAGADEIWTVGLRNPWRNSFDRVTGDLYIADVGGISREEINFQRADSVGGLNYGWNCAEGTVCSSESGCIDVDCVCGEVTLTAPIFDYSHEFFACAIIGGYVYRGADLPDLVGAYLFADFCNGQISSLRHDGVQVTELLNRTAELTPEPGLSIENISSFGEDAQGELYLVDRGQPGEGEVYRIIAGPPCTPFIRGDTNSDSEVDLTDPIFLLTHLFGGGRAPDPPESGNVDGVGAVDLADAVYLLQYLFTEGDPPPFPFPEPDCGP